MNDEVIDDRTLARGSDTIPTGDELGDMDVGEFGREVILEDSDLIDDGELLQEDDEDGELVDEEPSSVYDDEFGPDSKSYREMQSMYSKTQNKASELEGNLQQIEDRLAPLGGLDKVVQALTYVQSDPDYRALTAKKAGQSLPGDDESNLTSEAKEALDLVRKTVDAEVRSKMAQLKHEQIDPLSDQIRQSRLNDIADDLLDNYGEQFQDQLPTIERIAKNLPQEILDNPTYETMEDLFHRSLREDGKAESYYLGQHQAKVEGKKSRETGSHSSRGTEPSMPRMNKPKTMFDAARVADKKAAYRTRRSR